MKRPSIIAALLLLVASPALAVQHIWVTTDTQKKLLEFNITDTGNVAPQSTITCNSLGTGHGIAIDSSGNMWVADNANNAIYEFTAAHVAGCGASCTLTPDNGSGLVGGATTLNAPQGMWADSSGIWVANGGAATVLRWTAAHAATGGNLAPDQTISTGTLPIGLATDGSGNVYVANYTSNSLQKFNGSGTLLWTISGGSTGISGPVDVKLDSSGNTWVLNNTTANIKKWLVGDCTTGTCNVAADQTIATAGSPRGLTLDASNNLYEADQNNTGHVKGFNSAGTGISDVTGLSTGLVVPQVLTLDVLATATPTATATATATPEPTITPFPTFTATSTPSTPTATATVAPTNTPVPTSTPTATATPSKCPKHYYHLGRLGQPGQWGMKLNARPRGCL